MFFGVHPLEVYNHNAISENNDFPALRKSNRKQATVTISHQQEIE